MTYPTQADLTARLKWLVGAKAMAIVLALLMPTQVLAQSRTFYGADGRVSGRSITGSNGSTTFYDASGRVTGRSTTSGNLTTIYGSETDAVSAQPDKRADDMRQDNDPPDACTAEEREIIAMLERTKGRKLTEQEINLSLEQARALGEL